MDAINAAIAQAQQAAANTVPAAAQTGEVIPANQAQTTAVAPVPPGKPLSMENLMSGSISVDKWLKVKEFGLLIGDDKALHQNLIVDIEMTEGRGFVPKLSIKAGNPAQYWSTYDGVTCDKGGSWHDALAKARTIDPKARDYRSIDLPMVLVEGVAGTDAGTVLGYSTSTTNWRFWEQFYKDVSQAGLLGQVVRVKVGFKAMTNANKNNWGVMTWELIGASADQDGE